MTLHHNLAKITAGLFFTGIEHREAITGRNLLKIILFKRRFNVFVSMKKSGSILGLFVSLFQRMLHVFK